MKKRNKIKAKQQRAFLHLAQGRLLRKTQDRPFEMLRTSPLSCYGEGRKFSSTQKQNCTISYIKMYYKGHYVLSKDKFNSSIFNIIKAL